MTRRTMLTAMLALAACEAGGRHSAARPPHDSGSARAPAASSSSTTAAPGGGSESARDSLAMRLSVGDTARSAGTDSTLPALRLHDSLATPADSGTIHLYPGAPQRGGVIVAVVPATGSGAPTCTWKAATLPCSRTRGAIRAIIPLPADEPAGEFVLGISSPGVSVRRTIAVADRDFGRQVVLLDSALYALVRHGAEIARDARAVRQVLVGESEAARWSEGWLNPAGKRKATGYGVERLYVPASDSSRVMNLDSAHSTGSFGSDTTMLKTGATPSWRHAGVDIPLPRGSAARAAATGVVVDAAQYVLTGRTVILDHGQGIHTAYFHLDTITVHRGDIVRRGDRVGRVGSTGLATGPHLHYGVYVHGKDVDPAAWHALPAAALAP